MEKIRFKKSKVKKSSNKKLVVRVSCSFARGQHELNRFCEAKRESRREHRLSSLGQINVRNCPV